MQVAPCQRFASQHHALHFSQSDRKNENNYFTTVSLDLPPCFPIQSSTKTVYNKMCNAFQKVERLSSLYNCGLDKYYH